MPGSKLHLRIVFCVCIEGGCIVSSAILLFKVCNCTSPTSMVYASFSLSITSSQIAWKSKPKLPPFASMRAKYFSPTLSSFSARRLCQSSEAKFHFVMCSGLVRNFKTFLCSDDASVNTCRINVKQIAKVFCMGRFIHHTLSEPRKPLPP